MSVAGPDIRTAFASFFQKNGHLLLSSAPLVPHGDRSLLFTVAGMVPLKAYFLGQDTSPAGRLTSCQKCFRTEDLEQVGFTARHHTFFEMLGNFSIGDYYKDEAIAYAFSFLTRDLGLDPRRLAFTIHPDDEVARKAWKKVAAVGDDRIVPLSENFWEMGKGLPGPCGYDSELFWDTEKTCSCGRSNCQPGCDGDRWLEIWNLVFMEFDRTQDGTLLPLPRPSIDTGMGLERITAVVEGVGSNFDTSLLAPLVQGFASRSANPDADSAAWRVCADHVRGASFLVADGVLPGNEGRGYVLRRLIRRAALFARRAELTGGLAAGVGELASIMGEAYPELHERQAFIQGVIQTEEMAFAQTLDAGMSRLDQLLAQAGSGATLSGQDAFRLHDTYGLPVEVTVELARQQRVAVDMAGFQEELSRQQERSRSSARTQGNKVSEVPSATTTFVGYDQLEIDTQVISVLPDEVAGQGHFLVFLEESPFYAEAGGQVGDSGTLRWESGSALVLDTTYVADKVRAHHVKADSPPAPGTRVTASVDALRRAAIARHHSATHLLHKALREVLGESAVQRGSYVGPQHATFDFAFARALTESEIERVEETTNSAIRANYHRSVDLLPIGEARRKGAVALFGERYGETVRIVDFGGWAMELCGGTHVADSGNIGCVFILGEQGIGQGVRRISMVAGDAAVATFRGNHRRLREVASGLRVRVEEVPERVALMAARLRELEKATRTGDRGAQALLSRATIEEHGDVRLAVLDIPDADSELVGVLTDGLFSERMHGKGVALVLGKETLAIKVGPEEVSRGVSARVLVNAAAAAAGGKGGGRPEFGRGGFESGRRAGVPAAIRSVLAGEKVDA